MAMIKAPTEMAKVKRNPGKKLENPEITDLFSQVHRRVVGTEFKTVILFHLSIRQFLSLVLDHWHHRWPEDYHRKSIFQQGCLSSC